MVHHACLHVGLHRHHVDNRPKPDGEQAEGARAGEHSHDAGQVVSAQPQASVCGKHDT
jgi:hypothetical protein